MKSAYLSSKNRRKILQLDIWARQGRGCGAGAYPAATSWRKYWHYQQPSFMDTNRWQNGEKNVSRKAEQVACLPPVSFVHFAVGCATRKGLTATGRTNRDNCIGR